MIFSEWQAHTKIERSIKKRVGCSDETSTADLSEALRRSLIRLFVLACWPDEPFIFYPGERTDGRTEGVKYGEFKYGIASAAAAEVAKVSTVASLTFSSGFTL